MCARTSGHRNTSSRGDSIVWRFPSVRTCASPMALRAAAFGHKPERAELRRLAALAGVGPLRAALTAPRARGRDGAGGRPPYDLSRVENSSAPTRKAPGERQGADRRTRSAAPTGAARTATRLGHNRTDDPAGAPTARDAFCFGRGEPCGGPTAGLRFARRLSHKPLRTPVHQPTVGRHHEWRQ
jgi:hypothetical protein